ncbi:MAG TPA: KH domain-containing protein [Thermomicrobiales bacterium]|nr:KH domain-containing protein [Thermomicrobiales bacterium]
MSDQRLASDTDPEEHQSGSGPENDNDERGAELADHVDSPSGPPAEAMRGLVLYMASHLVEQSDDLDVEAEQRGSAVHVRLRVPSEELGKVIGRQGRVARAMRTALTIAGSRHNVRTSLDIEE